MPVWPAASLRQRLDVAAVDSGAHPLSPPSTRGACTQAHGKRRADRPGGAGGAGREDSSGAGHGGHPTGRWACVGRADEQFGWFTGALGVVDTSRDFCLLHRRVAFLHSPDALCKASEFVSWLSSLLVDLHPKALEPCALLIDLRLGHRGAPQHRKSLHRSIKCIVDHAALLATEDRSKTNDKDSWNHTA